MIADTLSRLMVLIRREIWESPFAFKWTPAIVGGLILLMIVLTLIIGAQVDNQMVFTLDGMRMFAGLEPQQQRTYISIALFASAAIFYLVMVIVVVFYLAGSLYGDRRDRSILFWKSLPVSDTLTVASKLLTAMVAAPVTYLVGIIGLQIAILLIASGYGVMAGIDIFSEIWAPANPLRFWLVTLTASLAQSLWLLPIFGWLMLCSSFAPRLPILIAVMTPLLISIFQHFWSFSTNFRLPEFNLAQIIVERLFVGILPLSVEGDSIPGDEIENFSIDALFGFELIGRALLSAEMWIGIAIGLIFLAGAVWFRRRATDN